MKYRFSVEIYMIGGLLITYGLTVGLNYTQKASRVRHSIPFHRAKNITMSE